MRRYYAYLKSSALYPAYLRHSVWTWHIALRAPVLSMLPFGVLFGTWWVLVPFIVSVPVWVAFGAIAPDFFAGGLYFSVILAFIALLPLVLSVALTFFRGYFACAALMFGNPDRAKSLSEEAAVNLRNCEAIHD